MGNSGAARELAPQAGRLAETAISGAAHQPRERKGPLREAERLEEGAVRVHVLLARELVP